ncbi:MAG TPA: protein translocase subunit SecF [Actinomycetota bacterium]|nr:protein translocase subunit SecF [Actinomycetota bacterium]
MRRLKGGGLGIDFIGRARTWFILSGVLVAICAGSLAIRGLNLGLEFRGGTSFEVVSERDIPTAQLREAVSAVGIDGVIVQQVGDDGYLVQTEHVGADLQQEVSRIVARQTGVQPNAVTVNDVGPRWGQQVSSKAIQALVIFLLVATAYISLRFEWKMAVIALLALVHDLVVAAGVYSLSGFVVTPATVIALLTILGYSMYDTIIVFDRVRERTRAASASSRRTYSDIANESLNQVVVRSLNTTITSLLPVGSLLFVGSFLLGATTLRELALALFLGMAAGTYSSIFFAVPLLAVWKEREQRWATLRARVSVRQAEPATGRTRTSGSGEPASEPAAIGPRSAAGPRPPKRRNGKRKRRR